MKLALAILAALVGVVFILVGGLALWVIFSQIFGGTDKEGTNIYMSPFYALVAFGGVALWLPLIRLVRKNVR